MTTAVNFSWKIIQQINKKRTKNTLNKSKESSNRALAPNLKSKTEKFCKILSENS